MFFGAQFKIGPTKSESPGSKQIHLCCSRGLNFLVVRLGDLIGRIKKSLVT